MSRIRISLERAPAFMPPTEEPNLSDTSGRENRSRRAAILSRDRFVEIGQ
jgi:hypothetical protein